MRTIILLILIIIGMATSSHAQIFEPDGLRMPGDWNTWINTPGMGGAFDLQKVQTGTSRWQTIFQYPGATGSQEFKFASTSFANPWGNQWAGNAAMAINAYANVTYGTPGEPNNKVTVTQNKWYTVIFQDQGYANTRAIFMETSAEPVNIVAVEQQPLIVTSLDAVNITAQFSTNPSPEEAFFLCFSVDNWATAGIMPLTVAGMSGSAAIPPQPNDTTVEYYIFSTVFQSPANDWDLVTIKQNNNNGQNYSYLVGEQINCGQASSLLTTDPSFPLDAGTVTIYFNATKLTRLTGNTYSLAIPNNRQYYGVPAAEKILKMNPTSRNPLASPNQVLPVCVEAMQNQSISIYLGQQLLKTETTSSLSYPLVLQGMAPGTYWIKAVATPPGRRTLPSPSAISATGCPATRTT